MSDEIERRKALAVQSRKYVPNDVTYREVGTNYFFEFPNGYVASLLVGPFAYGGAEIGLLRDDEVVYEHEINPSGIWPHVTPETVDGILDRIAALPPATSL